MMIMRKVYMAALSFCLITAAPAYATDTTPCTGCGTNVKNEVTVNIDFSALAATFNKVIDALVALGMKPSVNNGVFYYNGGLINNGNYNSGTLTNSLQNQGVYNTGSMNNNVIKLLAGNGAGGGGGGGGSSGGGGGGGLGGLSACGQGVCGRRW